MKYVSQHPQILGGKPVIAGTRIPIARILYLLKEGYTTVAVQKQYPHVSIEKIERAIDEVVSLMERTHASLF